MGLDARDRQQLQQRLDTLVQQQRELVASLERGQTHFRQMARSVWRVQEDERRRFARELHDGIGQNLTAIVRMLDHAATAADLSERTRAELARIGALAHATLAETRALSRQLRPQILDDLGLVAALRWLVRSFKDAHALEVTLDVIEPLPALGGDAETVIFRVAQEGLTNVVKHSGAQQAALALRVNEGQALLHLSDAGRGCDPALALRAGSEGQGSGLGGMRDRVQLFGGQFRVSAQPGVGFALEIAFPFPPNTGKLRT